MNARTCRKGSCLIFGCAGTRARRSMIGISNKECERPEYLGRQVAFHQTSEGFHKVCKYIERKYFRFESVEKSFDNPYYDQEMLKEQPARNNLLILKSLRELNWQ